MPAERKLLLRIISVNCFVTDETGYDDLFLKINGKKVWPKSKKHKSVRPGRTKINAELKNLDAGTKLEIEFWDYDFISPNDLLGKISVVIDEPGGPYFTDMVQNKKETKKASYNLEWEIDFQ